MKPTAILVDDLHALIARNDRRCLRILNAAATTPPTGGIRTGGDLLLQWSQQLHAQTDAARALLRALGEAPARPFTYHRLYCAGQAGCDARCSMLDNQGYTYCHAHGYAMKANGRPCRPLTKAEHQRLTRGETIRYTRVRLTPAQSLP